MDRLEDVLQGIYEKVNKDNALPLDELSQQLFEKDFGDISSKDICGVLWGLNPKGFTLLCSSVVAKTIYGDGWELRLGEQIRDGVVATIYKEVTKF